MKKQSEKAPKSNSKRNSIVYTITAIFIFLALGLLFGAIGDLINASPDMKQLLNGLAYICATVVVCFFVKKAANISVANALQLKGFDITVLLFALLGANSFHYIMLHMSGLLFSDSMNVESNSGTELSAILVISGIVIAPIAEETIFRFSTSELLRANFKAPFVIAFTTVLFAIVHAYNIQGISTMLSISLIWTVVYYYTGNLLYSALSHIAYNSLQLLDKSQIVIMGEPICYLKNGFIMCSLPWLVIQIAVFIAALVYFIFYFVPKKIKSPQLPSRG